MDRRGVIDLANVAAHMNERTRIVACAHVSNALGTVLPVREIVKLAHARGAVVLIDGAQAVPHQRVDLQALDCDFYAFSAHKMYGPTGIGALDRPRIAARGHASVARRRRHDPHRELREDHLQRAAVQVRSRHAQHLGRDRHGGGHRLHRLDRHRQHSRARTAAARDRHAQARSGPGPHHHRHRAGQGRGHLLHDRRHPSARSRHHPRRAKASRCAPVITAPCR